MANKRTEDGKQRRREQQKIKYREKYANNREKELERRRHYAALNREYELDRCRLHYDKNAGAESVENRIAADPSRGLEVAGRHLSAGHIGLDEYHRLLGERLALSNDLTLKGGRPERKEAGRVGDSAGDSVRIGNSPTHKSKNRRIKTSER